MTEFTLGERYGSEDMYRDMGIRLGLVQTTSGQYATRVTLDDDELDRAGFTYHRVGSVGNGEQR